jgi:hypothetical protein
MPQLDQFTYLTQFVWLCFFYMTFYVLLFNDGLPKISRILKLRAYLCTDRTTDTEKEQEIGTEACEARARRGVLAQTDAHLGDIKKVSGAPRGVDRKIVSESESQDVIFRTLNSSISYLNSSVAAAFSWCANSVDTLNGPAGVQGLRSNEVRSNHLGGGPQASYLRSIGEIGVSQLIKYNALEAPLGPSISALAKFVKLAKLVESSLPNDRLNEISQVWALRVQRCLLSSINKKKKRK